MNQHHNHLYLDFVPLNRKTSWVPLGVGCIYPHGVFSLGSLYQHSGYHNLDFGYRGYYLGNLDYPGCFGYPGYYLGYRGYYLGCLGWGCFSYPTHGYSLISC